MRKVIAEWLQNNLSFETHTLWKEHKLWFAIDYEVQEHPYSSTIPTFRGWSISIDGRYVVEYVPSLLQALRKVLRAFRERKRELKFEEENEEENEKE